MTTDTQRERAEALLLKHQQGITISGGTIDAMLQFAAEQRSAGEADMREACLKACDEITTTPHEQGSNEAHSGFESGVQECIEAIAKLPTTAPAADGVVVPREPTEAMIQAGCNSLVLENQHHANHGKRVERIYKAMLAASQLPPPPVGEGKGEG